MTRRLTLFIIFVILAGLLAPALLVKATTSDPWASAYANWEYRTAVYIDYTSGTTNLTDFQVKVTLNSSWPGWVHVNQDGSDIRFATADGTTIPYYIESWDYTNKQAVIWIKVPSIPAGSTTTVYLYYGNSAAVSESNGTAVFDFFDDFETWSGWTTYSSGVVSQSSTVAHSGTYSAKKDSYADPNGAYKSLGFTLNYPFVLEAWIDRTYLSGSNSDRIGVIDDNGNGYGPAVTMSNPDVGIDFRISYSGTINDRVTLSQAVTNDWYFVRFIWDNGNMKAEVYYNGQLLGSTTYTDTSYSSFTRVYIFGGYTYYVDGLRIRKYANPEPTVTVSTVEEQQITTATVTVLFRDEAGNSLDNVGLYVDGTLVGTFDGSTTLNVTTGTHAFKAVKPYYSPGEATFDIQQNTTITLTLTRIQLGETYSLSFDGSTTYIQTPLPDNFSTAFSVIVIGMFNNQSAGLVGTSNFEGKGYDEGFALAIRYGQFRFRIANASKIANVVSATAVFGKAVLVAGTFDGDTMKLYVDGELKSSLSGVGGYTPRNLDVLIGKGIPDWTSPWYLDGKIYLVLIYNRALSDAEIQQIYNDPLNPPQDGLVLEYLPSSVDTANNVWKDLSGNGNDGQINGATPERVSIPSASYYNAVNSSPINPLNVSVALIANNTTIGLIPSFLTLPYNETVTLNVSATGYESRTLSILTTINSLAVYLQPLQSNTTTNPIQPPTETISPAFKISDNYNDQGLWGGRLGIYFLTGNWSEGFRRFWTLNPMFELVLPVIFAFGIILSSYLVTRKPLVPVGTTAVMATFFGMLGIPLQLSIATPLAALFIFWIVYILWGFYKRFERS